MGIGYHRRDVGVVPNRIPGDMHRCLLTVLYLQIYSFEPLARISQWAAMNARQRIANVKEFDVV